ncbi:MAG: NAD(P)-dependent oxidoreductase [bacterium]
MKIFITGATGVVGRRAIPILVAAGHDLTAVVRDPARRGVLARKGVTTVGLDLFDRDAVRRAIDGQDVVINLATHMPSSMMTMMLPGAFRENDHIRREGAANLASAVLAGSAGRFIQESFAPVYDDGGARWLDESAPVRPVHYNRTVFDAERAAQQVTAGGRVGIVLRFAWFYGPDGRFFRETVKMVRRGMSPLPGRADAYFSSISHDDAATAVVAAIDLPAGIYNVCDDEPATRHEYVVALADAFGLSAPKPLPAWISKLMGSAGELFSRSQRMSNAKLRSEGWSPTHPNVREGFAAARSYVVFNPPTSWRR